MKDKIEEIILKNWENDKKNHIHIIQRKFYMFVLLCWILQKHIQSKTQLEFQYEFRS